MQEKYPTASYVYLEKIITKGLLENADFAKALFESNVKKEYFRSDILQSAFELCRKHQNENGTPINVSLLKNLLADEEGAEELLDEINSLDFNPNEQQTYLVKESSEYFNDAQVGDTMVDLVNVLEKETNNTREEFRELMQQRSTESIIISGGDDSMDDFICNGIEWNNQQFTPEKYYLYPFIVEENLTYITADPGIGKTLFLTSICNAIARGENFGPWECQAGPHKILYVEGELPKRYYQNMTKEIDIGHENFLTISKSNIIQQNIELGSKILLTNEWFRKYIYDYLISNEVKVVVFDNLSSLTPGLNENTKEDFDPINQYFIQLRAMGITVIVVHHTGKSGDQRGSSSRKDQVDKFIYLRGVKGHNTAIDGARFTLHFDKARMSPGESALLKSKELWYQKSARGNYEWSFERVNFTEDPEFIHDVTSSEYTQRSLADKYGKSVSMINKYIQELITKNYIQRVGKGRAVSHECTSHALDVFPEEILLGN